VTVKGGWAVNGIAREMRGEGFIFFFVPLGADEDESSLFQSRWRRLPTAYEEFSASETIPSLWQSQSGSKLAVRMVSR
jgi:hypothetical protein